MIASDVIIIGGGPVGLFCAFELGMHSIKSIIIDNNDKIGGQCAILYPEKNIYDIPAIPKIKAEQLIENLYLQSKSFIDNIYLNSNIVKIEKRRNCYHLTDNKNNVFTAKVIILATGAGVFEYNRIPIDNANEFENKSLFYSIQNKNLFLKKNVIIAGGGDSAIDWCLELKDIANSITLIHRRDSFRSIPENLKSILMSKVTLKTPYRILKIIGANQQIKELIIENIADSGKTEIIQCDYLLPFFGLKNDNSLINNIKIKFNNLGILVNRNTMQTNLTNVFAIGDCCHYQSKQKLILTGFSEAVIATKAIYKILFKKQMPHIHSTSIFNPS